VKLRPVLSRLESNLNIEIRQLSSPIFFPLFVTLKSYNLLWHFIDSHQASEQKLKRLSSNKGRIKSITLVTKFCQNLLKKIIRKKSKKIAFQRKGTNYSFLKVPLRELTMNRNTEQPRGLFLISHLGANFDSQGWSWPPMGELCSLGVKFALSFF
jgi:hypothetical protein